MGKFSFGRQVVSDWRVFSVVGGLEQHHLREEDKRFVMPYVLLRFIAVSPKPGWFEGAVRRHAGYGSYGDKPMIRNAMEGGA